MKITICGSLDFAKEFVDAKKRLDEMGHSAQIPLDTYEIIEGRVDNNNLDQDFEHCVKNDVMRKHWELIEKCDAILVLNYPKNGTSGYIGASTLIEIGIARYLKKRIFFLFSPPNRESFRASHELMLMCPIILNGDLEKLRGIMNVTICGSIAFFEEMLKAKKILEDIGHNVKLPPTEIADEKGNLISVQEYYRLRKTVSDDLSWIWARKKEAMINHYNKVEWADSVVVLNHEKNNIEGYIGANTLMEMGLALFLKKKIFLLNKIPEISYKEEILGMNPVVINGDFTKVR